MTSGTIFYTSSFGFESENNRFERKEEGLGFEDNAFESNEGRSNLAKFTIEFNQYYQKTVSSADWMGEDGIQQISLSDLRTNAYYLYTLNENNKTMHCIDLSPSDGEGLMDSEEYYEEEEPEEEADPYVGKDFYKKLLEMPERRDTIVYRSEETKDILGYTCKKVVMKVGKDETIFWTTDQIAKSQGFGTLDKYLSGAVLEVESKNQVFTYRFNATEIQNTCTLSENEIPKLPDGYHLWLGIFYKTKQADNYAPNDKVPDYIETGEHFRENLFKAYDIFQTVLGTPESDYESLMIQVNEKGTITLINFSGIEGKDNEHIQKLRKKLRAECVFEPVKLAGTAVPFEVEVLKW